ncbi:uncharacterized protein LOC111704443, partial [Eurytemora carolleeae]|uniref:uncharacterized protein LOC111704443 n=1 Tax=Eurytemora carolleeae TaxID=1294199 RepID=UPI000C76BCAF
MMRNAFAPEAYIFREGAILGDVPVTTIASVNKYNEYFYDEFIENVDKYRYNRILSVGAYPSPYYLFYTIREELKNHFQFHEDIQAAAFDAIEKSSKIIREKYAGKKLVKVAIHARRGDYLRHQVV